MDPLSHVVRDEDDGVRVVDVLRRRLVVVAHRSVGDLVSSGGLRRAGRPVTVNDRVEVGDRLVLDPGFLRDLVAGDRTTSPHDPSSWPDLVVHRDDDVVVVDKPAGVHMAPMGQHRDGTLLGALLWLAGARPSNPWGAWRPRPGHRLDRPTSGLVTFLTSRDAATSFQELLASDRVHRSYVAEVHGRVDRDRGTVDTPLGRDPELDYRRGVLAVADGGQGAMTHWEVIARGPDTTTLRLTLATGRSHQIRAHLASIGHPILGDLLYADAPDTARPTATIALRADRLSFPHPVMGTSIVLQR